MGTIATSQHTLVAAGVDRSSGYYRTSGTIFPLKLTSGQHGLFDLGRTVQALTILDFDAAAGSELELVHCAQYYDIGHKPNQVTFTGNTFRIVIWHGQEGKHI